MIFYFSATGNSYWMAKEISDAQGSTLFSITDELKSGKVLEYTLKSGEALGFVFPVHAWNPPSAVLEFINKIKLSGYKGQYTFALATCASSSGSTMQVLKNALSKSGISLSSQWEIRMPGNYIPLITAENTQEQELLYSKAAKKLEHINKAIRSCVSEQRLCNGSMSALKGSLGGFMFHSFAMGTSPFYVTSACTGCGLCEKLCLKGIIAMKDNKPVWTSKTCYQCEACINRCPKKAIQYGKKSESKPRYCHPIYREQD